MIESDSTFTPSQSDINTPNRSSWKPSRGVQGYNYTVSVLTNILTKREYLYREYFLNKGYNVNLPNYLTATPTNSLLNEVKHSYSFIDPTTFASEVQRDLYYERLLVQRFSLASSMLEFTSMFTDSRVLADTIFYLFNTDFSDDIGLNTELYKNQFRPMRKGISNMIRLHATGAIALPTEIRLHILASSKDIIHS